MSTNHRHQPAIFRTIFIVLLACFGLELKAHSQEVPTPAQPPVSNQTPTLNKFAFKHAKAVDVLNML